MRGCAAVSAKRLERDGVDQGFGALFRHRSAYPLKETGIAPAPPQIGQGDTRLRQVEAGSTDHFDIRFGGALLRWRSLHYVPGN